MITKGFKSMMLMRSNPNFLKAAPFANMIAPRALIGHPTRSFAITDTRMGPIDIRHKHTDRQSSHKKDVVDVSALS
jgi:hypothetical protein